MVPGACRPPNRIQGEDTAMVEKFERAMIERFLRDNDLRFLVDQDGDFVLDFDGDDVPDYRILLVVEGADEDILAVRIITGKPLPESARGRLERFVAEWNRSTRWPKAYLVDDSRGRGVNVVGGSDYPLGAGVHPELLSDLIVVNLSAASQFMRDLRDALGTPTSGELETWLGSD